MPPTIAQQRGYAFAPIPFAVVSFFSSCYVIYYILYKKRQKLKRLYHRFILAMNVALLPLTFTYAWSTFAVPVGTPYYVGASGTMVTCTAQGFIYHMLSMTVPTYYGSLSLQAFMAIRNNFKEAKYRWIEYPIHVSAWCVPAALSTIVAVTENFNPSGSGCAMAKAPRGCEADPDVPCVRGENIGILEYTVGLGLAFLYFVFPPSIMIAMYCWTKKIRKNVGRGSCGMQQLREYARKQMLQQVAIQISIYLFSFWFTCVPSLIVFIYGVLTGTTSYGLHIFANCLFALQGFVIAVVYFTLQKLGTPKLEFVPAPRPRLGDIHLTVRDIRSNARRKTMLGPEVEMTDDVRDSLSFNIFDGVPDEDSPWARYFDQEDNCDSADDLDEEKTLPSENIEID